MVIDVIFDDDSCFIVMASSPKLLDRAVDILVSMLVDVFSKFDLAINFV